MERLIRYALAADGVRIANSTLRTGQPLSYLAGGPLLGLEATRRPDANRP